MPLWYYTLGSTISSKVNLTIPFSKLIINLLFTILPTLIGLALSFKFPVIKEKVSRFIKYLVVCLILTFFTLTTYSKFYIFSLMHWQQWLVGPLLPWSGFLLGGLLAFIARLPSKVPKHFFYFKFLHHKVKLFFCPNKSKYSQFQSRQACRTWAFHS